MINFRIFVVYSGAKKGFRVFARWASYVVHVLNTELTEKAAEFHLRKSHNFLFPFRRVSFFIASKFTFSKFQESLENGREVEKIEKGKNGDNAHSTTGKWAVWQRKIRRSYWKGQFSSAECVVFDIAVNFMAGRKWIWQINFAFIFIFYPVLLFMNRIF